jgi:hypothetical protein
MILIDLFITEKCIRDSDSPDYGLDDSKIEGWIRTIISTISAYGMNKEYQILIHSPASLNNLEVVAIQRKLKEFYQIHTHELKNDLREMHIETRVSLSKGIPIMIIALSLDFFIDSLKDPETYTEFILIESFDIIGWVSMWKPMELMLYERWPLKRKLKSYDKMLTVPIKIVHSL